MKGERQSKLNHKKPRGYVTWEHHGMPGRSWRCVFCKRSFIYEKQLMKHTKEEHGGTIKASPAFAGGRGAEVPGARSKDERLSLLRKAAQKAMVSKLRAEVPVAVDRRTFAIGATWTVANEHGGDPESYKFNGEEWERSA